MRPYLALTSLLFGLHLGVAAVAALDLPAPVLGLAAFAAGACLGLGLSLLARRLPLPHLLLFALLLNPSAWVAVALLRPEPDPMNLGLFVAIVAFTLLLLGTLLLLLAALLPPGSPPGPWPWRGSSSCPSSPSWGTPWARPSPLGPVGGAPPRRRPHGLWPRRRGPGPGCPIPLTFIGSMVYHPHQPPDRGSEVRDGRACGQGKRRAPGPGGGGGDPVPGGHDRPPRGRGGRPRGLPGLPAQKRHLRHPGPPRAPHDPHQAPRGADHPRGPQGSRGRGRALRGKPPGPRDHPPGGPAPPRPPPGRAQGLKGGERRGPHHEGGLRPLHPGHHLLPLRRGLPRGTL